MDKPDVAALIARLSHIAADRFGDRGSPDLCGEAAAALQSQQERIAELERLTEPGQINWAERCGHAVKRAETAEARVAELERLLLTAQPFIDDDGDDGSAVSRAIDAAIAARKPSPKVEKP